MAFKRNANTKLPLSLLAYAAWLFAFNPCWADDQKNQFLELQNESDTTSYDLNTVQVIQPGKFSIKSTTIDDPDLIKYELKVLDTLQTYCSRPDGKYPAPADLLTLGPTDRPVKSITVTGVQTKKTIKSVSWPYPYRKLDKGMNEGFGRGEALCGGQDYFFPRQEITNGHQEKELFDCKRGLHGFFLYDNDDPAKVRTEIIFVEDLYYLRVCYAVTHEWPYLDSKGFEFFNGYIYKSSPETYIGQLYKKPSWESDRHHDYFNAESERWLRKPAEQGFAPAQSTLGDILQDRKDIAEAAKWYRLAADQGDGDGQISLGIMYYVGDGHFTDDDDDFQVVLKPHYRGSNVPQDYVQAYKWLTLAMAHSASDLETFTVIRRDHCIEWRDKFVARMTTVEIAEAQRQVAEWRPVVSGKMQPDVLPATK